MRAEDHEAFKIFAKEETQYHYINEVIARGDSCVQQFYNGAVVFITGGTGFLGKQLIEKLFRSCKIKKVYYLLRAQREKSFLRRLQDVFKDPLYEYLHKNQPDFISRILPVEGDITKIRLGIDPKVWEEITEEVNVIFHSAATINFMEKLQTATLTNVRGTREMIILGRACKNLRAFVHVSTAYVHATKERCNDWVMEKFYDPPLPPELLIKLVEDLDEDMIDGITSQLIQKWPNTYTFTKAVSEELLRKTAADLPICIVRPAIVLGGQRELTGWVDKSAINGPIGFIMGACLGGLHTMYGDCSNHLDMVPVDLTNNAILVAAQETAARLKNGDNDILIYTVTRTRNPSTVGKIQEFCELNARQISTPKIIWDGYVIITKNVYLFMLLSWFLQTIPAFLADKYLQLTGKKPIALKLINKAYKQNLVYEHFMMNQWKFGDSNLCDMSNRMSSTDRIIFQMDSSLLSPLEYFYINALGTRKYLLKDGLKGTDYAARKQFWLRIANYIFLTVYAYVIWKIIYSTYYVFSVMANLLIFWSNVF